MSDYPENISDGSDTTMRDMAPEEKPREKALKSGFSALDDSELMAIIFGTGTHGKSVLSLSREILRHHGGHLSYLASMSVKDICRTFKGIGPAKALTLLAGLELGVRAAHDAARIAEREKVLSSPEIIYQVMHESLSGLNHEEFWVLYLNQCGKLIRKERIGIGGVSTTGVDVRIILREALLCLASSIVLVHNHPSGNLRPSPQDEALTRKICEAAKFHDIRVNDHMIFTDRGFFSFHIEGLMPKI